MTSSEQWRYVATENNPADFVSRGMDSLKLKTCELWWNGPKFLMSNQYPQRQIPVAVIKDPGRSITSIVEPDLTNLNENRLYNWLKITKIIQLIWKRWSVDHLNSLQQRNKWHFEKKNAKIGDMVIIKEDNLPSCQWSLGRINNIYPGKDSKRCRLTKAIHLSIEIRIDEAHFWLNGYVNKQNCRIWSEANPQVYVETPLHPEKLTVWCTLWAGGILLQKR
ncbi:DUF5641 domain-containing protein [Trichonephila clavipes]|nr:DUF5641 domain-containing protein [Trichonephila clavipes]